MTIEGESVGTRMSGGEDGVSAAVAAITIGDVASATSASLCSKDGNKEWRG